ncbi:MAG TPA: serine protein kinase RIO [Candidatus Poseidoniales archaeon]|nr:serine protein kinase RIO [Candidatus Poseidoniales archaeon]
MTNRGDSIARKRGGKSRSDEREWTDLMDAKAADLESNPIDIDGPPPKSTDVDGDSPEGAWEDQEEDVFGMDERLDALDRAGESFHWMKERRFERMFREIEGKLSGVLGKGGYDWVDRRVFDQVFDQSTLMAVYKLMNQGHIDTLDWPIARGKEAHVFHATAPSGSVAVKIFHTSNAVFKGLLQYIDGDPRFGGLRRRHRELVNVWVRKENRNLLRMRKNGVRVPEPLALFRNVLIMDYLGDENGPSPRLKDLKVENAEEVYQSLLEQLKLIWQKSRLAHADFSEYNVLIHEGEPWIIDAGQAVDVAHPSSKEYLVRDVTRLVQWAKRNGVEVEVADAMLEVLGE